MQPISKVFVRLQCKDLSWQRQRICFVSFFTIFCRWSFLPRGAFFCLADINQVYKTVGSDSRWFIPWISQVWSEKPQRRRSSGRETSFWTDFRFSSMFWIKHKIGGKELLHFWKQFRKSVGCWKIWHWCPNPNCMLHNVRSESLCAMPRSTGIFALFQSRPCLWRLCCHVRRQLSHCGQILIGFLLCLGKQADAGSQAVSLTCILRQKQTEIQTRTK